MAKITFILGGARSGKSAYALNLAQKHKKVAFIATGQALDKEMRQRINLHKKARPSHWHTFEEDKKIASALKKIGNDFDCVIIDCLTLWVSNLILAKNTQSAIKEQARLLVKTLKNIKANSIVISNEVGLGIVPQNKLARSFRDIAGKVNQAVAKGADKVLFMVSGIPMKVKG